MNRTECNDDQAVDSFDDKSEDNVFYDTPINGKTKRKLSAVHAQVHGGYTQKYRIIKTVLMIMAWISYGLNFELTGTTLEDLRVLLSINYQSVAFLIVIRNIGYIIVSVGAGLVLDKLIKYADLLMAFASILIIIRKLRLKKSVFNQT
jgi:hypothetical protein